MLNKNPQKRPSIIEIQKQLENNIKKIDSNKNNDQNDNDNDHTVLKNFIQKKYNINGDWISILHGIVSKITKQSITIKYFFLIYFF